MTEKLIKNIVIIGAIVLKTPFYGKQSTIYKVIGVDDLNHIQFLFKYQKYFKL